MPNQVIPALLLLAHLVRATTACAMTDGAAVCDTAAKAAAQAEDVPLEVLRAITRVETGRAHQGRIDPWPWAVNLEGKGYWFATEGEAKSFVFKVFKAGARSFDVGCFQINYRWHGKAFRSIDAMFDPGENALYAARFLKDLYAEFGSWPAAAGAYHSRTPDLAHAYSTRFRTVLARLEEPGDRPPQGAGRQTRWGGSGPLIPVHDSLSGAGVLGSLFPDSRSDTAFITFN